MTGKRLFVAIELPASTKRFLVDLDPQIYGVRWLDAEQMHLTLAFFGVVPEDVDLKLREKLSAIVFGAFFLPIVGVGTFPPKGPPKIIWIGVGRGHPHLFQLHKRVQEAALGAALEPLRCAKRTAETLNIRAFASPTGRRLQIHNPRLESGAATCSSDRRSAGTPIQASTTAPKIISAAATRYPMNKAVIDPVPMIHPNNTGAPTPPASVPVA